ncbi:MAG: hypothetical protein IJO95_00965 [Clostridia bacterium]|nr:hypothetical protein [Clostridia bacterium]
MVFADFGRRKRYAYALPFDVNSLPSEKINCPVCKRTWNNSKKLYSDSSITFPIVFTNNCFSDYINGQLLDYVSSAAKEFLLKQNIKDLSFSQPMPVMGVSELSKEKTKELQDRGYPTKKLHDEKPDYFRFSVAVGASLHEDSNFRWVDSGEYVCAHCGYGVGYKLVDYLAPIYIKYDSWNGTDLFRLKEIGGEYCTEGFKKRWEEAGLTGIDFKEIEAR